jgi:flagellar basal-body rod protein FlgG
VIRALFTASTGMQAQQLNLDVIAHNLANVNTAGFKRSRVDFQDLLYVTLQRPGAGGEGGALGPPSGLQIGSGTRVVSTTKSFSQGLIEPTGNPLDLAIRGEGFFAVTLPDGTLAYTRSGSFQLDGQGRVVSSHGYLLDPQLALSTNVRLEETQIDELGNVFVRDETGATTQLARLQLTKFLNPAGLESLGDNLFLPTDAAGAPLPGNPGDNGMGAIQSRALERSNVDIVQELIGLITAQRAYEINSRAIRSSDEMLAQATAVLR